jgi:hypothetical protein
MPSRRSERDGKPMIKIFSNCASVSTLNNTKRKEGKEKGKGKIGFPIVRM